MRLGLIIFFLSFYIFTYSQIGIGGSPATTPATLFDVPVYNTGGISEAKIKAQKSGETAEKKILKKLRFAEPFSVSITPENSGVWDYSVAGKKIWRMRISSTGAYSINIIFNKYYLRKGVRLYLFNSSMSDVLGAFTYLNNTPDSIFAVSPIPCDEICVELQVPSEINDYGVLEIGQIAHDYTGVIDYLKDGQFGKSGSCNPDINCYPDSGIQIVKNSVCRIMYNGVEICTGTLINNTRQNGTPYVITAHHCLCSQFYASSAIFYFGYESPSCGGPDGKFLSVSGCQLVSTVKYLDFSLVKLYLKPTILYKPYYAGWNVNTSAPGSSYCIHHPRADVKKIAVENNPVVTADFGYVNDDNPQCETVIRYDINTHWKVRTWEAGTTEKGSSGGPLFDKNNLIVGDLTGGLASCASSIDDYFAKLSDSWDRYPLPDDQLKYWLDPDTSGVKVLQGYDPFSGIGDDFILISNINDTIFSDLYNRGTWGYWSGHNSNLTSAYAEKINHVDSFAVSGLIFNVAKAYAHDTSATIFFQMWEGAGFPEKSVYAKEIKLNTVEKDNEYFIPVNPWYDINGSVFIGYSIQYNTPSDTFALYQTAIPKLSGVPTTFMQQSGTWYSVNDLSNDTLQGALDIKVVFSKKTNVHLREIKENLEIYPNPASENIYVSLPYFYEKNITYKIINSEGKIVAANIISVTSGKFTIDISFLKEGLYCILLNDEKCYFYNKFIIIK